MLDHGPAGTLDVIRQKGLQDGQMLFTVLLDPTAGIRDFEQARRHAYITRDPGKNHVSRGFREHGMQSIVDLPMGPFLHISVGQNPNSIAKIYDG
ncbi:MAG: hypothetical protein Q7J57_05295, partial [Gemmobacter sp.]|nr:hypothetical protein [Gemmobacter sp.]